MGSLYKLIARGTDGLLHRLGDPVGLTTPVVSDDGTKPIWIEGSTLGGGAVATHTADTSDAHDASAISFVSAGLTNTAAGEVQTALEDLDAAITGGGGPGITDRNDIARDYSLIKDECYFQNVNNVREGGIVQVASGTGAATSAATAEAGHIGILQLSTGTTSSGSCALQGSGLGQTYQPFSGMTMTFGCIAKIPTLSTTGVQGFDVVIGLNGLAMSFRYSTTDTGADWQARDFNNIDHATGVTVDTSWHYYEIVLTNVTDAKFYIDGSLVHTETTIGTGAGEILGPVRINKRAGTTARTLLVDAYWYQFEFTSPR